MILETFTPKSNTNDATFIFDLLFNGDVSKTYSCVVIGSNLPQPIFKGFITKTISGSTANYMQLEFLARCNQTQMTVEFLTATEAVEKKKLAFFGWISQYFTWINFVFNIFSLKTLKFITKAIAVGFAVPVIFGALYAGTEYTYESYTGDDFEDSAIVEVWKEFTIPKIGQWFREDSLDDASHFGEFLKDKSVDAFETTKDKAGDLKEAVTDKIDDIRD